jgi:hypothetical protein
VQVIELEKKISNRIRKENTHEYTSGKRAENIPYAVIFAGRIRCRGGPEHRSHKKT